MTAVTALALLISKVLDKARELSAKFFEKEMVQTVTEPSEQRTPAKIPQMAKTPKPIMSAEAAAYPKLLRIYKGLNRQNGIIFDAERERNNFQRKNAIRQSGQIPKRKTREKGNYTHYI